MMDKTITFDQLKEVLSGLGYAEKPAGRNVVFTHPESDLYIVLPNMATLERVSPMDILSVQNTLANSGIASKDRFDSLLEPLALWNAIIDEKAAFEAEHGYPPELLELPVVQAYDLAKLDREELGRLSERVMNDGIKAFEKEGLLGIPVKLIPGRGEFQFKCAKSPAS